MLTHCVRAILVLAVVMAALAPVRALRSELLALGLPAEVKAKLAATGRSVRGGERVLPRDAARRRPAVPR